MYYGNEVLKYGVITISLYFSVYVIKPYVYSPCFGKITGKLDRLYPYLIDKLVDSNSKSPLDLKLAGLELK